jgi:glycosyltransferase involved in cell wall biosynthesis
MKSLVLLKTSDGAAWAYRQIKVLIAEGVEVAVCLPRGKMFDQYASEGVKVYELDFSNLFLRFSKAASAFRKILREFQPDIIHSHFVITTVFARMYRILHELAIPVVFQVPGPLHLEHRSFRSVDLWLSGSNDYWVATCNWTRNKYLQCGVAASKVFLSFYGTDLTVVKKYAPGKLRKELNMDDNDFLIAMVSYMYAPKRYLGQTKGLKGHEDFLEALSMCMAVNQRIKGVVIGGAWNGAAEYEAFLNAKGMELCGDRIAFVGTRSNVPELYADVDLVIHPSYSENLGGAAESLLLGVPTITSNVGGFPDIVIEGETGYLVNPGRPDELANAILKAVGDHESIKQMAAEGSRRLRSMLDVERTGREVVGIYRTILERRASQSPTA